MIVSLIYFILLQIQDLYDWLNFDPLGNFIFKMLYLGLFGVVIHFCLRPLMFREIEKRTSLREDDVEEWEK